MYRWSFFLPGNTADIWDLAQSLPGDIDILHVVDDDSPGEYFLASRHLEVLDDPQQVLYRGARLLSILNGVRNISLKYCSPIILGELLANGVQVSINVSVGMQLGSFADELPEIKPFGDYARLINHARGDSDLHEALFLLGQEQNWFNLFKIVELIEHDWGKEKTKEAFGSSTHTIYSI